MPGPRRLRPEDPVDVLEPPAPIREVLRRCGIGTVSEVLWLSAESQGLLELREEKRLYEFRDSIWRSVQQGALSIHPDWPWHDVLGPLLPLRARKLLYQLELQTVGEVVAAFRERRIEYGPNFGRSSLGALRGALALLGVELEPPAARPAGLAGLLLEWDIAPRLAQGGIDLELPWEEVLRGPLPPRAVRALREAGAISLRDVLAALRGGTLFRRRNLGRRSVLQLKQALDSIADRGLPMYQFGSPSTPGSVAELCDLALAHPDLTPRDRDLLRRRFFDGARLQELSRTLGVSRERVRQVLRTLLSRLGRRFGPVVRPLLQEVVAATRQRGGLLHQVEVARLTGEPDLRRVLFGLVLAQELSFSIFRGHFLCSLGLTEMKERLRSFRRQLLRRGLRGAPLAEAGRLLEDTTGLRLEDGPLQVLLTELLQCPVRHGRLALGPPALRHLLANHLQKAGRPVEFEELVKVLRESGRDKAFEAAQKRPNWLRALLLRHEDVYRLDPGTYVHRTALPISGEHLQNILKVCLLRLEREGAPVDVRVLLRRLKMAGLSTRSLGPHLLLDILRHHPLVVHLSGFWVRHAACSQSRPAAPPTAAEQPAP